MVAQLARPIRFTVLRVDENQVDVGRNIQFAAAQFAHADDQQGLRRAGFAERGAVLRLQDLHQTGLRLLDAHFRQRRHRLHHLVQTGQPVEVAQDQLDHHLLAQLAHGARQLRFIVKVEAALPQQVLHFRAVARREVIFPQPIQQRRVYFQRAPGITAAAQRLL